VIVVDASAIADLLLRTPRLAACVAAELRADGFPQTLDLADVEVVSVLERKARRGELELGRAEEALDDLASLPVRRHGAAEFRRRIWELRDELSAYDAAYVALAEALSAPLLTTDSRLARAGGHRAEIVPVA
jgi:predicted nucleic acid-binding protein